MMAECGVYLSPTLQTLTNYPRILQLTERRETGAISVEEEAELESLSEQLERHLQTVRRLLDFNLRDRIVPGTDSGVSTCTFGHLDFELQLLVKAGFTPGEALTAATRTSSMAIELSEIGTIEPGKIADLAAFDGDPTVDASAFSRVTAVFQAGKRIL
jgi:imidazolonepropionase-like amidohydrolase